MALLNDTSPFVLEGETVILKIDNEEQGIYLYVEKIVRDMNAKNRVCWLIDFSILTTLIYIKEGTMEECKKNTLGCPAKARLLVNDEHIRGEAFTIEGEYRHFCKINDKPIQERPKLTLIKGGKED